jgi:MYXO-CTERM domain-containing protein
MPSSPLPCPRPGEANRTWRDKNLDQPGRRAAIKISAVAALAVVAALALARRRKRLKSG